MVDIAATRMRRNGTRVAGRVLANVSELEARCPIGIVASEVEGDVGAVGDGDEAGGDVGAVSDSDEVGGDVGAVGVGDEVDVTLSNSLRTGKVLATVVPKEPAESSR